MPKQDAIIEAINENLEELRTLIDDTTFTREDAEAGQTYINNIEILLMQLQ